ncbi:MAG: quinolinate synthase NadA [Candidatus Zixiibacteriota bacterium]|nr:MAG: quinolinate synthase NadA [candidate division Zixibacteria bacterium]
MDLTAYLHLPPEELKARIQRARREKEAVLLVHNYQRREIQEIADFLGDSLGLAQEAERTSARLIVFCGVEFMAETAKILNPEKKVLLPDRRANCPMAGMIDAESLSLARKQYPDAVVVTYVNSTAAAKALSDVCCTSTNAVRVVRSVMDRRILFTPDRNLAEYCRAQTGADVIPWMGFCYVHDGFRITDVEEALAAHPGALLLAHPECRPEIAARADLVCSTTGMIHFVRDHTEEIRRRGIIIGTEIGLVELLQADHPDLPLYPLASSAICATMKLTTLAKVAWCLDHEANEMILDDEIRRRAYRAVKRMMEIG